MNTHQIKYTSYFLLIVVLFSGCLKDDDLNLAFRSYEPVNIGDGLIISNPSIENMDSSLLTNIYNEVYNDDNLWSVRSLWYLEMVNWYPKLI